mmetsp:Transcript_18627/g.74875  ORF Transcript_18627/g.74875 Transcript_18627/m.74875 type:complete len:131 (-) Transcript_18627:732-1124(-)
MEADFASQGLATALVGLGCFWGAERKFWEMKGVHSTAVGYSGGSNAQPSYKEVCSGATGHAEVVRIIYDPAIVSFGEILDTFWDSHDPTTVSHPRGSQCSPLLKLRPAFMDSQWTSAISLDPFFAVESTR